MNAFTLHPIGHVESALKDRAAAPRQPDEGAPDAWLVFDDAYLPALDGLVPGTDVLLLTWLHGADRHTLTVRPRDEATRPLTGVFATRSPDRPNPIGLHRVHILSAAGSRVHVRNLEAIDATPILDVKPLLTRDR
ncbi:MULTISPECIES: tRNA (N6-threonylcarbamoyladenosine(37)-N6)-methyltransferase TrmO [unclassified Streptomyces]|uniref:tRNA (N6-threonylcarbamoyladenosine(37)-N6)-methyltransferase TrmO n=1 Tax=unclassified Streptomyces TaxID=2593676 RepID=UPI0022B61E5A|nr:MULTISPECIES: tRNA (N6-threonylcarbamoyladenosine(37)-N6)-methyltransferase TrmO [unclassified Streptomyces]MCZ7414853.1 tRNA (N6-threonylcarbamoyladenosine(37)-N6)-methyltransferase TrmO [Streptomyces sp. WMMC897]MCZ7431796.1 tRNA (N6-threonylcarbamoyladenosine(37)-N6)-methyltransferase TrmO [Streptomyces sp. WMMC1477]